MINGNAWVNVWFGHFTYNRLKDAMQKPILASRASITISLAIKSICLS